MFRIFFFTVALLVATTSTNAFAPQHVQTTRRLGRAFISQPIQAEKADIPDAISQGPQEGQIPAVKNNQRGEKTMESLAKQGSNPKGDAKTDDNDDDSSNKKENKEN